MKKNDKDSLGERLSVKSKTLYLYVVEKSHEA